MYPYYNVFNNVKNTSLCINRKCTIIKNVFNKKNYNTKYYPKMYPNKKCI